MREWIHAYTEDFVKEKHPYALNPEKHSQPLVDYYEQDFEHQVQWH